MALQTTVYQSPIVSGQVIPQVRNIQRAILPENLPCNNMSPDLLLPIAEWACLLQRWRVLPYTTG